MTGESMFFIGSLWPSWLDNNTEDVNWLFPHWMTLQQRKKINFSTTETLGTILLHFKEIFQNWKNFLISPSSCWIYSLKKTNDYNETLVCLFKIPRNALLHHRASLFQLTPRSAPSSVWVPWVTQHIRSISSCRLPQTLYGFYDAL